MDRYLQKGFTLIELSIVLVIIGLIGGGILLGQDLINIAVVHSQIAQIDKYQAATNTFREKYSYLPGDIPDPDATQFGFQPRAVDSSGTLQGDGDGMIAGVYGYGWNCCGETLLFWRDLSDAKMLDQGFSSATAAGAYNTNSGTLNLYMPSGMMRQSNAVYVWSYRCPGTGCQNSSANNFFTVANISQMDGNGSQVNDNGAITGGPGMTALQAYMIDTKTDDGLPLSGKVTAHYLNALPRLAPNQISGDATTCFDFAGNGDAFNAVQGSDNNAGAAGPIPVAYAGAAQYSLNPSNSYINCALSFQIQ